MRTARARGAKVLALTNVMGAQATREADGVLYTRAGLEIGVAATKTFVSQITAMYLIALRLAEVRGTMNRAQLKPPISDLKRLPHLIAELLERDVSGDRGDRPRPTTKPSSFSISGGTSGCRSRWRARSSSRRSPTSPPMPMRPGR